jgi:chromosome partitioning protein
VTRRVVQGLGWPAGARTAPASEPASDVTVADLGWPHRAASAPSSPSPLTPRADEATSRIRAALRELEVVEREAVSRETPPAAAPSSAAPPVSRETVDVADTPIAAAAAAAVDATRPLIPFPRPVARRVITVANQKGGVGKTTTTVNLAAALALNGARVLCVDLDPQGNASTGLGVAHGPGTPSVYDVLIRDVPLADVRVSTAIDGLSVVPATLDLAGAEIELVSSVAREFRLKKAIAAYPEPVDYVLIDCPPSLGLLTLNALVAAEEMVIPIQCEFYALEGLTQLLHTVDLVRSHLNGGLTVSSVLLTMYDARTRLSEQVADEVRRHFGPTVLDSVVPRSVRVSEAPSYGQSVLSYDPASRGAQAYLAAARELATRGAPVREKETSS